MAFETVARFKLMAFETMERSRRGARIATRPPVNQSPLPKHLLSRGLSISIGCAFMRNQTQCDHLECYATTASRPQSLR